LTEAKATTDRPTTTTTDLSLPILQPEAGPAGIRCPDGQTIPVRECFKRCRIPHAFPMGRCAPLPLLDAMFGRNRKIRPGVYSTTELLKPTRAAYLSRVVPSIEDVFSPLWRTWGTAVHSILDHDFDGHLTEERLHQAGDADTGGGQIDQYDAETEVLADWKVTGAYKVKLILKQGVWLAARDWAIQTNRYAQKLERLGFPVRRIVVFAILRDHGFRERKEGIPPAVQIEVGRISGRWLDRYFEAKRRALDEAHATGYAPPCKAREIWGGRRCKSYCPEVDACRAMCIAHGEDHPRSAPW
jgi:hypothetical protein